MNANEVLACFQASEPVCYADVEDCVQVPADSFYGEIYCSHCRFTRFSAACAILHDKVTLADTKIDHLNFYAAYFLRGIIINGCIVKNRCTFQSGGHNGKDDSFTIMNTRFEEFVDFEDCWFTGPFRLENVEFIKGTNLLGNQNSPMAVFFDIRPEIIDVIGQLNVDTYES